VSELTAEQVRKKFPGCCAVHFMGGWMIRLYPSSGLPLKLSDFQPTESDAWADAAKRLTEPEEEQK